MTVLTAIPCFGVPTEFVERAVRHALAQSVGDHVVLVVGDGERPPIRFVHERLVVGVFADHHGTPFVQQAMILGSPFTHYAPMGADDYTEREHLARLLALRAKAAGSSRVWWHGENGRAEVLRSPRTWIEFGCFRTDVLRSVGGYAPHEPFGQDSVLTGILLSTVGVKLTARPTYHKVWRATSLTHHPQTRQGSPARLAVKARNREVLLRCAEIGWRNVAAIRAYRASLVPAALGAELEDRAADVARWLS